LLDEPSSRLVAGLTNLSIQAAIDVREWSVLQPDVTWKEFL
jgi:hypothetical protein